MRRTLLKHLLPIAGILLGGAVPAAAADHDAAYPALDDRQIGAVRHIVTLARRPDDDFTDTTVGTRSTFDGRQFQYAWMSYTLGITQSQVTPAYRELYKDVFNQLIRKMTLTSTWSPWLKVIEVPDFKKYLDPSKDWRDPVREKNIMYSGHLLQMVGLYEDLYEDRRYDAPDSITFSLTGDRAFTHSYNHESLARIIRQQFVDSKFAGIECEPNLVFAECNQHPVLGLMSYDKIHGTKLANIREAFWRRAVELGYVHATDKRFAGPRQIKQEVTLYQPSGWNDGWTGVTLHAWDRDAVGALYPSQRDASLAELTSANPAVVRKRWAGFSTSTDFGYLSAYAAEMGDAGTRQTLLDYADTHFKPVWHDGDYYYPRHDIDLPAPAKTFTGAEDTSKGPAPQLRDDMLGERFVGPLTGNALLAFARINPGNGLWNLYNNLGATYAADGPEVFGVSYPQVLVKQAYYDRARSTLAIGVSPGTGYKGQVSLGVRNLPASKPLVILIDGEPRATLSGGHITMKGGGVEATLVDRRTLNLRFALDDGRTIMIKPLAPARMAAR